MIRAGDRVVLTEDLTVPGGFLRGPRMVARAGSVGVVRREAGMFRNALVAFPTGYGLEDYEVPGWAMAPEPDRHLAGAR